MPFSSGIFVFQEVIAKTLGLDPAVVGRIVLDIQPDAPPRARVSMWLTNKQCEELARIFEVTEYREVK